MLEGMGIVPAVGPERGEMSEGRRSSPSPLVDLVVEVVGAYPPAVPVVDVVGAYPPAVPVDDVVGAYPPAEPVEDVTGAYPPVVPVVLVLEVYSLAVLVVLVGSPFEAAMRCWDLSSVVVSSSPHCHNKSLTLFNG
jgi:hypothetical protein